MLSFSDVGLVPRQVPVSVNVESSVFATAASSNQKMHEHVSAPMTILPLLLLAFLGVPPPTLSIVAVCLELRDEPLHTSLAHNLKIAKVSHENCVACLNICFIHRRWLSTQAFLELGWQEHGGNVCLQSTSRAHDCSQLDLFQTSMQRGAFK